MSIRKRVRYLQRIGQAYLGGGRSQLSFWHETPELNANAVFDTLGEYYMTFRAKADYAGPFDDQGIPLLDYRGSLGEQYNPIAIAQYGLGNCNLYLRTKDPERRRKFLLCADWLTSHLEPNAHGLPMWMHHFNWEYRDTLIAPWYSALAQGQGISLLVRAYRETGDRAYWEAANAALRAFKHDVGDGGVIARDGSGNLWFEEYIVHPPTHVLNGFLWASWGLYDYLLLAEDEKLRVIYESGINTLERNLQSFDTGFWSLYEHSGTRIPMIASNFYHRLHIVQLRVMARITGVALFSQYADKWTAYTDRTWNTRRALATKALFKVFYY